MYFFDTYALVEIYKGNTIYSRYNEDDVVTTLFNLMELYHIILKEKDHKTAELIFNKYLRKCVKISPDVIKEAIRFRLGFIKRTKFRISYIDAIGYILSRRLNMKFLTGDQAFKDLENVEYVK